MRMANVAREIIPYAVGALESVAIGALMSPYIVPAKEGVSEVFRNPAFYVVAGGLGAAVGGPVIRYLYGCFGGAQQGNA